MAKRYKMTPKRRVALRKAQLASARKRRKGFSYKTKRNLKRAAIGGAAIGIIAAGAHSSVKSVRNGRANRAAIRANGKKKQAKYSSIAASPATASKIASSVRNSQKSTPKAAPRPRVQRIPSSFYDDWDKARMHYESGPKTEATHQEYTRKVRKLHVKYGL